MRCLDALKSRVNVGHITALRTLRTRNPKSDKGTIKGQAHYLPPGLIAFLYRVRWNIEKAFDETKNRFGEQKSWASSATAKTNHARFVCLAYNLTLLLEGRLAREKGIENTPEQERKGKEREKVIARLAGEGTAMPAWFAALEWLTQRGVKLIRWLSDHVFAHVPWARALHAIRKHYHRL